MEIKKAVVPAFAFLTLFFAITPWRHPFLNQPPVLIVTAGLTALCIFAFRRKLFDWKTIALLTAMAYAASVVAALAGWSIDSHEGLTHLLDRLALSASLEMVLGFPLFTYSAPIVLIVLAVNRLIGKKIPPRELRPR